MVTKKWFSLWFGEGEPTKIKQPQEDSNSWDGSAEDELRLALDISKAMQDGLVELFSAERLGDWRWKTEK